MQRRAPALIGRVDGLPCVEHGTQQIEAADLRRVEYVEVASDAHFGSDLAGASRSVALLPRRDLGSRCRPHALEQRQTHLCSRACQERLV